jgi:hypothetical protein
MVTEASPEKAGRSGALVLPEFYHTVNLGSLIRFDRLIFGFRSLNECQCLKRH